MRHGEAYQMNKVSRFGLSQGNRPAAPLRLNGEKISTREQLETAFKKGPFMYQLASGTDMTLYYCKVPSDLDRLIDLRIRDGVIIRYLKPDPLPPAPPVYVAYQHSSGGYGSGILW